MESKEGSKLPSTAGSRHSAGEHHQHHQHHHRSLAEVIAGSKFKEGQESDWWFASTAIPLLAATLGPMANVLSIGALVTYWRMDLVDEEGNILGDLEGIPFKDPRWCFWINAASLILAVIGNVFLLFNFTQRIRYIIALPMTIVCWYLATGFLIGILVAMNVYVPPTRPEQTYTQGYWYGVCAAAIYLICAMLLMINMLGFFLGHYPDTFTLTDHQRTLILQTMLYFVWLAGGGAVFARIETDGGSAGWGFVDALYFCDVTILTVGFGDLAPSTNLGRGLVFPFSVGGIIMLGLVIASIHKFARELGEDKVVNHHFEKMRLRTWDRSVTNTEELMRKAKDSGIPLHLRSPNDRKRRKKSMHKLYAVSPVVRRKKPKLLVLREEKDRFLAMRKIQQSTQEFKRWWALSMSIIAFGILWCIGAVVFWQTEMHHQGMTYFQALYFCYVSLLTIGYGDLAPKSNAGRAFFVVWSLIAVPTMTVLVSDMGDTIISNFKKGSEILADFTVLPQYGKWREFLERYPWLLMYLQRWVEDRRAKKRIRNGMPFGFPDEAAGHNDPPTIETLAAEAEEVEGSEANLDDAELARRLAFAIQKAANDVHSEDSKRYTYEEWVEFTRLIRFTSSKHSADVEEEEEEEGLVEWDWIGEDSPMMSKQSEAQFVLDRLCESLVRYTKRIQNRATEGAGSSGSTGKSSSVAIRWEH